MSSLRLILIVAGVVLIVGIALWGRFRRGPMVRKDFDRQPERSMPRAAASIEPVSGAASISDASMGPLDDDEDLPQLSEPLPVRARPRNPPSIPMPAKLANAGDGVDLDDLPPMHAESWPEDRSDDVGAMKDSTYDLPPTRPIDPPYEAAAQVRLGDVDRLSVGVDQETTIDGAMSTGAFIASQSQVRVPVGAYDTAAFEAMRAKPDIPVVDQIEPRQVAPARQPVSPQETVATQQAVSIQQPASTPPASDQTTQSAIAASQSSATPSVAEASRPRRVASTRKIIALRLSMNGSRVDGTKLKMALESAGLSHGKYGIFHRTNGDGTPMFSAASMVEPGTFDLNTMSGQLFPGITLFAQLPGSQDGTQVVNQLIECARQLEKDLGGVVQDERGLQLIPAREQRLRDDVADFLHLIG